MAGLNETPGANRIHISFFGLRNAGKSTLVNALTGSDIAIVSDVAGTTTDPVSKAMEILPLGPCLITDTAGLDDEGELGRMRVEKTLKVLETTDVAVWVRAEGDEAAFRRLSDACAARKVAVLEYRRGDSVEELKTKISQVKLLDEAPELLDGLVAHGDRVLCVCPIDESAPKGRLILPQVQAIRACLDLGATATVCQPGDVRRLVAESRYDLVITDSQAFGAVSAALEGSSSTHLTSFSILFARQKGDIAAYREGLKALKSLRPGDTVLVAEGCVHHRQCNDIGTVKIPKAIQKLAGCPLDFRFTSGTAFGDLRGISLVVQCGGCMLTRREVLRRIALAREAGVPVVNYGMALALAAGVDLNRCVA